MCGDGHVMSVKEKIETLDVVATIMMLQYTILTTAEQTLQGKVFTLALPIRTSVYTFCLLYDICTSSKPFLSILAYQKLSNTRDSEAL